MEHKVSIDEISDGKLYTLFDTVLLACDGCHGAAECCCFAEDTITLDPYDIFLLERFCALSFPQLLQTEKLALSLVQGLALPHLNFLKTNNRCPFLNTDGRCEIHAYRPGLCRLFPLARYFAPDTLYYVNQIYECPQKGTTPVRIADWLGLPQPKQYEDFLRRYQELLTLVRTKLSRLEKREQLSELTTALLKVFFLQSYENDDFYAQYDLRERNFLQYLNRFAS